MTTYFANGISLNFVPKGPSSDDMIMFQTMVWKQATRTYGGLVFWCIHVYASLDLDVLNTALWDYIN